MAKQPKLTDTLEVFYGKLNLISEQIKDIEKAKDTIVKEAEEFKNTKLLVETKPLEEAKNQFIALLVRLELKSNELQDALKAKKDRFLKFYLFTGLSLLVSVVLIYFLVKAEFRLNQVKTYSSELEIHNSQYFEFLDNKKLTKEFEKWVEKEQ